MVEYTVASAEMYFVKYDLVLGAVLAMSTPMTWFPRFFKALQRAWPICPLHPTGYIHMVIQARLLDTSDENFPACHGMIMTLL